MQLIGVTGGIGMGKSVAGVHLDSLGVRVVDTDDLARQEVLVGSPAWTEIRDTFGLAYFLESGGLDRQKLGQLVFNDPGARRQLEDILHPRIFHAWSQVTSKWAADGVRFGAVIIPLLFEKDYEGRFTSVACVACTPGEQRRRLLNRGWTDANIESRNRSQLPVSEKIDRSNFVAWTEGDLEVHRRQWERILSHLGHTPRSSEVRMSNVPRDFH